MFYSRPRIDPLGWDLVSLPTPNGSRNFDALTSDGRPIDFRFSSGWLTVERGEVGASRDDSMQGVLSMQISPFGITDIFPEQLCDILGLTVSGQPLPLEEPSSADRGFDWSGKTTYWCSTHSMLDRDDAEQLAAKICRAFPDVAILQPLWLWQPPRVRCRRVNFMMPSDEIATFAVGCDPAGLQRLLAGDPVPLEEFDQIRYPWIDLWRTDTGEDLTGSRRLKEKHPEALDLAYQIKPHRRYRIWVAYQTADARAHAIMQTLLQVFESHFARGLEVVDLQTGEVIEQDWSDEEDTRSYSVPFKKWCLESAGRYLSVDVWRTPDGQKRFVGARPTRGKPE